MSVTHASQQPAAVSRSTPTESDGDVNYHRTLAEQRKAFDEWRTELRTMADDVAEVTAWLLTNIEPLRTVNRRTTSYGHKHTVERALRGQRRADRRRDHRRVPVRA